MFRIQTPHENPSTTANLIAKSWFFTGVVFGLFLWFSLYQVVTWEGWVIVPPPSKGPAPITGPTTP